jgi:hypothetical protein
MMNYKIKIVQQRLKSMQIFLLGYHYSNNISQLDKCSHITHMMPSKTATTDITFRGRQQKNQQQQKARQGAVTVVGMNALDHHIERLEAKLSFLIRSYDAPHTDLLYQYDKKIATVKQEINDAMEQRRC